MQEMNIGAGVLSRQQAEQLLPDYNNITKQITSFRIQAANYISKPGTERKIDVQFHNTISILGGRGSGKTSMLLTIKHELEKGQNDIILPLIIPDQISRPNDTLGWILSFLKNEAIQLEKMNNPAHNNPFNSCIREEKSSLLSSFEVLYRKYLFRSEEYHDIIQRRDEGIAEFKRDNMDIITADHELISSFQKFIDQLLSIKTEQLKNANTQQQESTEPLLFIFFDDVDISAHRCPEVLDTIRIYLSHPSVVSFVAGDYLEFSEAMTLEFLRKDQIPSRQFETSFVVQANHLNVSRHNTLASFMNTSNALEIRQSRSQEYLKKVFPPAFRYHVLPLTDERKAAFSYNWDKNPKNNQLSLLDLVNGIKFKQDNNPKHDNNSKQDNILPERNGYIYLLAFDEYPRGLINPYYFLYQRKSNNWILEDLKRFLSVMISSSYLLKMYEHQILDFIDLENKQVNFNRLMFHLDQFISLDEHRREENYIIVTLFSLACLFDRLLCRYHGKEFNLHGNLLVKIIIHRYPFLFPEDEDEGRVIALFIKLTTNIPVSELNQMFVSSPTALILEKRYYQTLISTYSDPKNEMEENQSETNNISYVFESLSYIDYSWLDRHIAFIFQNSRDFNGWSQYFMRETVSDLKSFFPSLVETEIQQLGNNTDQNNEKNDESNQEQKLLQFSYKIIEEINKLNQEPHLGLKNIKERNIESFNMLIVSDCVKRIEKLIELQRDLIKEFLKNLNNNHVKFDAAIEDDGEEDDNEDRQLHANYLYILNTRRNLEEISDLKNNIERKVNVPYGDQYFINKKAENDLVLMDKTLTELVQYITRITEKNKMVVSKKKVLSSKTSEELKSIYFQLTRVIQGHETNLIRITELKKIIVTLEALFTFYKNNYMDQEKIEIDDTIEEALRNIKNVPFAGAFDELCNNLIREIEVDISEYRNTILNIKKSILSHNDPRKPSFLPMILDALQTLESKVPNIPLQKAKVISFEKQLLNQIYAEVIQKLLPIYVLVKTNIHNIENKHNDGIEYFLNLKRALMEYYEQHQDEDHTHLTTLIEISKQSEHL